MKRVALKLCIFLLLGAILNVAVAWAFTLFGNSVGAEFITLNTPDPRSTTGFVKVQWLRSGWPFLTVEGEETFSVPNFALGVVGTRMSSRGAISYEGATRPLFPFVFGFLPISPFWLSSGINTIFYAAILWPPFAALGAFRRRRRIKRGLCPKCAYDLRGRASENKLCPECGISASKPA